MPCSKSMRRSSNTMRNKRPRTESTRWGFGDVRVIAVIPCYNEASTVAEVVRRCLPFCVQVIVIDNMSSDETAAQAMQAGADVQQCLGRGAGAATRLGVAYALNPRREADVIVTLDGDGQHDPSDIPTLLKESVQSDVVIGSRFLDGGYVIPRYRKFGIDVITGLLNIGSSMKLTDGQSCFRVYSRDAAEWLLRKGNLVEDGFAFSVEWLVKIRRAGYCMSEVPVKCIYHSEHKMNSSSHPITHGLSVAIKTVKWRLWEKWGSG